MLCTFGWIVEVFIGDLLDTIIYGEVDIVADGGTMKDRVNGIIELGWANTST